MDLCDIYIVVSYWSTVLFSAVPTSVHELEAIYVVSNWSTIFISSKLKRIAFGNKGHTESQKSETWFDPTSVSELKAMNAWMDLVDI